MEESAAIARVRVMAMLSTYSNLEDQLNSDDLESEVERGSNFKKKTTPVQFSTLTGTRSDSQRIVFCHLRNDLSQFVVKLQEHGRS